MSLDPSRIQFGEHFNVAGVYAVLLRIADHAVLKSVCSAVALGFQWFFGGNVEGIQILAALIAFDTLTGFMKAWKGSTLSSSGFFRFALKITIYLILVATAALVDRVLPVGFASVLMITFLSVTEAISVLENVKCLGFPVPTAILKRLKIVSDEKLGSEDPETK